MDEQQASLKQVSLGEGAWQGLKRACPQFGSCLLFDLKVMQSRLAQEDRSSRGHSTWLKKRWPAWERWLVEDLRFPSCWLRREPMAGTTPGLKNAPMDYHLGTPGFVALLGRMSSTLKYGHERIEAANLLRKLTLNALAGKTLSWSMPMNAVEQVSCFSPPGPSAVDVKVVNGLVVLAPLLQRQRFLGKAIEGHVQHIEGLEGPVIQANVLMEDLAKDNSVGARKMIGSMASWMSRVIETSLLSGEVSFDPLDQALTRGVKRTRKIPNTFKQAIAKEASKGKMSGSSSKVAKLVQRFRRHSRKFSVLSAKRWADLTSRRYWKACKASMANPPKVIGLTSDATRLGHKDQLWSALTYPSSGLCCWAPPAVGASVSERRKKEKRDAKWLREKSRKAAVKH